MVIFISANAIKPIFGFGFGNGFSYGLSLIPIGWTAG